MSKNSVLHRPTFVVATIIFVLTLLGGPPHAFSQSCALCYTQAASAGARMIQALQSGILILIVPPTLLSICMVFILRHKSKQFRDDEPVAEPSGKW